MRRIESTSMYEDDASLQQNTPIKKLANCAPYATLSKNEPDKRYFASPTSPPSEIGSLPPGPVFPMRVVHESEQILHSGTKWQSMIDSDSKSTTVIWGGRRLQGKIQDASDSAFHKHKHQLSEWQNKYYKGGVVSIIH